MDYTNKAALVAAIRKRATEVFPLPSFPYEYGLKNGLLEAATMVESASAAWVSTEDRLPELDTDVLVYFRLMCSPCAAVVT